MKKVLVLLLIAFSFNLVGCGYVEYIKTNDVSAELIDSKKSYINKIDEYIMNLEFYPSELDKCTTFTVEYKAQINEANNIDELANIYKNFVSIIDSLTTKEEQDIIDFNKYKEEKIAELKSHVNLDEYRIEERQQIETLQVEFTDMIKKSKDKSSVDSILTDYKIKVYSFEKKDYYIEKELEELKEVTVKAINDLYIETNYYPYEQKLIINLINKTTDNINNSTSIKEIQNIYENFKSLIKEYKTIDDYYKDEVLKTINKGIEEIKILVGYDALPEKEKQEMDKAFTIKKEELIKLNNIEEIEKQFIVLKKNFLEEEAKKDNPTALSKYNQILVDELKIFSNSLIYRDEQLSEINALISNYENRILTSTKYTTSIGLYNEVKLLLDDVKTNEELWSESYNSFITERDKLYGHDTLLQPTSLLEASNYQELANIIDYYAFYQESNTKFLCNKFRVKYNSNGKTAIFIRNEVYWHAELLNGSVGINAYFDLDKDYIVFELIPYAMASIGNKTSNSTQNLIQKYNSTSQDIRNENFNDFPYLKNQNKVIVNNSQQLWYAFEHRYQPVPAPNSRAEKVLNKAKEILREIIKNDMSDEEKIYNILRWFSSNVIYAHYSYQYNNSSNMDMYPAENFSKINSLYPEGPLFDGNAICSGFARTCGLFLGIEGINFKRIIARNHAMNGKNTINSRDNGGGGFGFHEYLYVNINNKWYFSDPEHCVFNNKAQSNIYMLSSIDAEQYGFTVQNTDIHVENDLYIDFYKKITSYGESIFEPNNTKSILNTYYNDKENGTISIIVNYSKLNQLKDEISNYVGLNFDVRTVPYINGNYSEIIIFKE